MLILEGSDLIGKSTAYKMLSKYLNVQDRHMPFTEAIKPDSIDVKTIKQEVAEHRDWLFVILYVSNNEWFDVRLSRRDNPDEFDVQCRAYNQGYIAASKLLVDYPNVISIDVYGLDPYQKCGKIFSEYLKYENS